MNDSDGAGFYVASDIGGTFTDTVVIGDDGSVSRYKAATTPDELVRGVLDTFALAAADHDLEASVFNERIRLFSHGTTVATNALLQQRGARTGVLLTEGFVDTMSIMRGYKGFGLEQEALKNYRMLTKRHSIVDQRLVRGIPERIDYLGRVVRPLDETAARAAIRDLVAHGVEAIAICLLWCTMEPAHELRLEELVREEAPDVYVSISSKVLPRTNEYERGMTTAVNAFLGPEVAGVTATLQSTLADAGLAHNPLLMQSNGGLAPVSHAADKPVEFLLSGPVGGVVGSQFTAETLGERNVVTTDMGGTSFDVGMIVDGRPLLQPTTNLDYQPIGVPSVAVKTVGAGGGSVARIADGILQVGPESAGAVPGPACYGTGGVEPTVTDADVVLGFINPESFLGGRRRLDADAAREAIRSRIAEPLSLSIEEAAYGIKQIVDAKMVDLIRQVTIHKGFDVRQFTLVAFGGAGPVHAHAFGSGLSIRKIVVPVTASVHSAFGIAASDLVVTRERSLALKTPPGSTGASEHIDPKLVNDVLQSVERDAAALLEEQGFSGSGIEVIRLVDMRFRFQIHELTIPIPTFPLGPDELDQLVTRFIETYELRFGEGSAFTAAGVELVNWRVVASGKLERPKLRSEGSAATGPPNPLRVDRVYLGEWYEASVFDESALRAGAVLTGPAVVELPDTNIVIGTGQSASVDGLGNVVIVPSEEKGPA
jgi:N-methylhydantoinase A